MSLKKEFDLTSAEGLKLAKQFASIAFFPFREPPIIFLVRKGFEFFSDVLNNANERTLQEQRKTAVDIIKAGKESGVDEIEIELDQKVGVDIGADLEGIPVKFMVGKNGKMKLKVKYK